MAETPAQIQKTLPIEGVEPLLLFGFNDQYLRTVERAFPDVRVVARGNALHLRGSADAVIRLERVIGEMMVVLNRNGNLTQNDVQTVLDLASHGEGVPRPDTSDVILFTPGGGTVRAKTPGQSRLVTEARTSDIVFASGPAGTGKCVAADTLVLTERGLRPIETLASGTVPGDQPPLALAVSGIDGLEQTSHFYDGGTADTLRVRTRLGYSVEVTPEHPLLVLSESGALTWRRADELAPGDVLALQRGQHLFGDEDEVGFAYAPTSPMSRARPLSCDRLDPDLGYFLGLVVGDGSLTAPRTVILSTADEEVRSAFEQTAKRFGLRVVSNSPQRPHDYRIASVALRALCLHLGCSEGTAETKRVPHAILGASEPVARAFLQGLFDADGTVDARSGAVSLSTVSVRLAREVQMLLLNVGIVAGHEEKRGRCRGALHLSQRLTIAGTDAALFAEHIGFRLARKASLVRAAGPGNPNVDVVPHVAALIDRAVRTVTLSRAQHKRVADYRLGPSPA